MIVHLVLFRPRTEVSAEAWQGLAASFERALGQIPSIRRARVGRRVMLGRPYEALMGLDFPFAAAIEFDDREALLAYLEHPAHHELASRFSAVFDEALLYDFELQDATAGPVVWPHEH